MAARYRCCSSATWLSSAKGSADAAVYETEKSLREHGDKVDAEIKSEIEKEVQKVKDLVANADAKAEELKAATDALMQVSMKMGEAIYKASQDAQSAGAQGSSTESQNSSDNNSSEKVVDAEYEEVKKDEDKK